MSTPALNSEVPHPQASLRDLLEVAHVTRPLQAKDVSASAAAARDTGTRHATSRARAASSSPATHHKKVVHEMISLAGVQKRVQFLGVLYQCARPDPSRVPDPGEVITSTDCTIV
jgi:hypothetical protein